MKTVQSDFRLPNVAIRCLIFLFLCMFEVMWFVSTADPNRVRKVNGQLGRLQQSTRNLWLERAYGTMCGTLCTVFYVIFFAHLEQTTERNHCVSHAIG